MAYQIDNLILLLTLQMVVMVDCTVEEAVAEQEETCCRVVPELHRKR